MIQENDRYLITTDAWFFAPDGKHYRAAWGKVTILGDDILGVKTNAKSSNWFAKVGSDDNHIIIAGCQIHYAVRCENRPDHIFVDEYTTHEGVLKEYRRPNSIYLAE